MVFSALRAPISLVRTEKLQQRSILRRFHDWQDHRRLSQMEDHRLRDIGLTREQVRIACKIWDAPKTWRQR